MRRRLTRLVCMLGLLVSLGCESPRASIPPDAGPAPALEAPPEAPLVAPRAERTPPIAARVEARAGDSVRIPSGALRVGSLPGTPNRRPSVEADLVSIEIPAVDVDRLPYPNDPDQPARLVGTRAEAARLCEAEGRRLCEELEWERACRGETTSAFPTGASLDIAACTADPSACASPTGALSMGVVAPEWTATEATERLARLERNAVVRGGFADQPAEAHRCGTRHAHDPAGGGRALAFRCCGGDAPDLAYPDVGLTRLWRDLEHDAARWQEILASIPELAPYAEGFRPYGETEALRALARGDATEADMQWELTRAPFAWSPSPGEEVWIVSGSVVSGSGGERSLLAALYPLPDGTFRHGASFVFEDEAAPIAILRARASRAELLFSTCWACMGESGVIRFGEDATLVIAQQ